eukprot:TRINITY_DN16288_c0_g1_i1.p1 TRINITY_DN16288_c0_g1~~TRINITY_DN16288_c0_g1_i1.p1  ORF type:complete len:388 (-),score=74.48 TRINITY_DN16288_c0_g1_i1:324-1433(-)
MAFLLELAYGGPQTWSDHCGGQEPVVDANGLLAPPWGDAIRAAVLYEKANPGFASDPRFADDGPAGQVVNFLCEQGFEAYQEQAGRTEQAAQNMQAAPSPQMMGIPMGVPVDTGGMPPHLACLQQLSKVEVKEKADMIEALTAIIGQEIEMPNRYKIFADGGEEEIFFAAEETNCIMRQVKQCFPDCAPWKLNILYTQGGNNQLVYRLDRDFSCTCCCFNRPVVNVTDVTSGQKIGSFQDPFACCDLTFRLRDANDNDVLKAAGGCCQWGLCCPLPCGPCAEVNFPIVDLSDQPVGHVQKKVPGCCKFCFAPDVDNYKVDFGKVTDPQWKALLIGLTIFMDFRYFNENSNDDEGGLMGAASGDGDGGGE